MDATGPSSIDAAEVAKFQAMAAEWWDPAGKFKPLHMLNPVRLDYIAGQIAAEFARDRRSLRPFEGLRLLDIGCGGGLVSEPMARLGADVTGADAAEGNIRIARLHAGQSGLKIDYRATTAEALLEAGELTLDDLLGSAAQRAHGGCGDARRPLAEVLGHGLGDDAPGLLHLGDGAVGVQPEGAVAGADGAPAGVIGRGPSAPLANRRKPV